MKCHRWAIYIEQKFICHILEAGISSSILWLWCLVRAALCFQYVSCACVFTCTKSWCALVKSLTKVLISFTRTLPSWLNHLPKPSSLKTSTLLGKFQHNEFWGRHKYSNHSIVMILMRDAEWRHQYFGHVLLWNVPFKSHWIPHFPLIF